MGDDDRKARERERERRELELGRKKINALSFGFFNLPVSVDDEELPGRAASAAPNSRTANRPEQPQRSYTVQSTSDAVTLVGEQIDGDDSNPFVQRIMMYPSSQGSPLPFTAIIDSGTSANWIDEEALQQLQIQSVYEAPTLWITFNGKTVRSEKVVQITWNGIPNRKTRVTTFRVATNAPFEVVLGSKTCLNEGILSFDKTAWIMAKKPITKEEEQLMEKRREEANKKSKTVEEKRQAASLPSRQKKEVEYKVIGGRR